MLEINEEQTNFEFPEPLAKQILIEIDQKKLKNRI